MIERLGKYGLITGSNQFIQAWRNKLMARRNRDNGKFLRLTGLWPSRNEGQFTGRSLPENHDDLKDKLKEAIENDASLVWSIWENEKKRGKKDPEFILSVFVGDAEEKPRSRRDRDEDDEEKPRKSRHDRDEEDNDEEEKPKKSSKKSKSDDDDAW